jgi:hypothetical protein
VRVKIAVAVFVALSGCQVTPHQTQQPSPAIVALPKRVTGANIRPVGDARRGYGTRTARATIDRLRGLGVNTVAVLMEGRMRDLHDDEIRVPEKRDLEAIRGALFDANAAGMATILIPHIYIDDGSWRGDIKQASDAWWESYYALIDVATGVAASSETSVLSIGVELK